VRHTRIIVTHYGGPDALRVVEEECPEPKDGASEIGRGHSCISVRIAPVGVGFAMASASIPPAT